MEFTTMGHRAWYAWHCLPRDDWGQPPKWRKLEREHGLSNNTLRRLIWDQMKRPPGFERATHIAQALNADREWLFSGVGDPPKSSWPIPPRPNKPEMARLGLSVAELASFERDAQDLDHGVDSRRRGHSE